MIDIIAGVFLRLARLLARLRIVDAGRRLMADTMTTWQAVVYGGSKSQVDDAPRQPSKTFQSDATANRTAPETPSVKNDPVILMSPQARLLARNRLAQMHREGLTWYELQKRYRYPAATLQHWAAGRGRIADDMVERLIAGRLIYVDITDAIPAIPCPTCGKLHQVDDCHGQDGEPVIVPAGARVVQGKPTNKPSRKRWRIDLSSYAGRVTAEQVRELIEYHLAADPIDAGSPARILRLVGDVDPTKLRLCWGGWSSQTSF